MPNQFKSFFRTLMVGMLILLSACGGGAQPTTVTTATDTPSPEVSARSTIAKNPGYSSPIAISDDDALLVVANTLNGTLSLIDVSNDTNTKLAEVQTGDTIFLAWGAGDPATSASQMVIGAFRP